MSHRPKAEDPTNSDPPLCADDCTWRQKYTGFALQRNALRSELAADRLVRLKVGEEDKIGMKLLTGGVGCGIMLVGYNTREKGER